MTEHDRPVGLPAMQWGLHGRRRALLIHGLSASAAGWWRIADALAGSGYHVTAPDLRGHGRAPRTASYRLEGYAADLWEFGDGWDLVVGHSLGGTLAALISGREGFTQRLVLLDPVLMIPEDQFDDVLADQLSELDDSGDPAAVHARNPSWHPEDAAIKALALQQTSRFVVERTFVENRPWWYLDLLSDVPAPTTIVGADPAAGALFDRVVGEEMTRRIPRLEVMTIAGAGHNLHREAAEQVLEVLLS